MQGRSNTGLFHFSVDDVLASLLEVTDRDVPLFDHPLFAFLRSLHQEYAADVAIYLFLEQIVRGRRRRLDEVSNRLRDDLGASTWLSFGPHGLDYDHPPHGQSPDAQLDTFEKIYDQIDRFAGSQRRTPWVRLHHFSESFELADFWRGQGVTTLLLTDKSAVSYRLPEAELRELAARGVVEYEGLELRRTHERMEGLASSGAGRRAVAERLDGHLRRHRNLIAFTHESDLGEETVQEVTRLCFEHAGRVGLAVRASSRPLRQPIR